VNRKAHWDGVYTTKQSTEVGGYQAEPTRSLELLREVREGPQTTIIDIGGGDSTLVDVAVEAGNTVLVRSELPEGAADHGTQPNELLQEDRGSVVGHGVRDGVLYVGYNRPYLSRAILATGASV
jgi:hypothetical protein